MSSSMTKLPPAQWRVLNKLFFTSIAGGAVYAVRITKDQGATWDDLLQLESAGHLSAFLDDVDVRLKDLNSVSALRLKQFTLRLTPAGTRLVCDSDPNNVICMLARQPSQSAPVRSVRTEADVDDTTLIDMAVQSLIKAGNDRDVQVTAFRRLPDDLKLRLTPKGRRYFPN